MEYNNEWQHMSGMKIMLFLLFKDYPYWADTKYDGFVR